MIKVLFVCHGIVLTFALKDFVYAIPELPRPCITQDLHRMMRWISKKKIMILRKKSLVDYIVYCQKICLKINLIIY